MRKRVGIFGATEEALRLVRLLSENPDVHLASIWDEDPAAAHERTSILDGDLTALVTGLLTDDISAFLGAQLDAVVASEGEASFLDFVPDSSKPTTLQVVTPLTARLLWGYGVAPHDRKAELLLALHEVIESVDLTIDSDEVFGRMLEIAVGVTGADGGSLMLVDPERRELRIRIALGVEPELWPKIRVPIGHGIAGKVAAEARSIMLRGKADRRTFDIVRERFDVESALSVPLVYDGKVLGVLNLHHSTRTDAFDDEALSYLEQLAQLDAKLIARTQAHEALRDQAARYEAVREVQEILSAPDHLTGRLRLLCDFVAARVGNGIVSVYILDSEEQELRLAATSLGGGAFGGEYRLLLGQGIDGFVASSGEPAILKNDSGSLLYVSLPLTAGEHLVGLLSIQSGNNPPRGRAAEETLKEIAAAVADGLAQVDREARMIARSTRLNAINETGIRMLSSTQTGEIARLATSSSCMILEADHAVLRLQDDQSMRYVIRSYYGSADGRAQEKLFKLDKQVSVSVIKKRTAQLIRSLEAEEKLTDLAEEFRSALAAPIKLDGRIIGTLSLYDKVNPERFYAGRFTDDDEQVFGKLVSYVERALSNARIQTRARQQRNFDDETRLPNATYMGTRIREEIARAKPTSASFCVASCRIENVDELQESGGDAHLHRVILRTAEALRTHIRDFDVLGRTTPGEFTILLPEPGHAPDERVVELARAVADAISKDETLNSPTRVVLAFGQALYPEDGSSAEELLEHTTEPKIRMV